MAAERDHLRNLAFKVQGAFLQKDRLHLGGRGGMQAHCGELVHIPSAFNPAPVNGPHERFGRQVDDKDAALLK